MTGLSVRFSNPPEATLLEKKLPRVCPMCKVEPLHAVGVSGKNGFALYKCGNTLRARTVGWLLTRIEFTWDKECGTGVCDG